MSNDSAPPGRIDGVDGEELLRHVLDTVPGGLFTVDPNGTITSWNRAMQEITGYAPADVIGKSCGVLQGDTCFGGATAPEAKRCALFVDGQVWQKRCHFRKQDGDAVAVVKNARIMRNHAGEVVGAIEALTDLSGILALQAEVATLREQVTGRSVHQGLVGRHPSMQRLYDLVELAAGGHASVLIEGETGTGKELVARAIHAASPRRDGPFVRVSCAALSESLLESELFGHVRGAFTGAVCDRVGRFEAAHGGTIFLDEIGDVSPAVQTKLLRVLQEREFERVGDTTPRKVDIRVVAATHRNLGEQCERGAFRQDLFYRLAVIPLHVPPLRERKSDIPLLVDHFIDGLNRTLGRSVKGVESSTLRRLIDYEWPGNVRELEHALEYAFVVARGELLGDDSLPRTVLQATREGRRSGGGRRGPPEAADLLRALREADGNRTRAAAALGVSRVTLWKWLKALGLENAER